MYRFSEISEGHGPFERPRVGEAPAGVFLQRLSSIQVRVSLMTTTNSLIKKNISTTKKNSVYIGSE